MTSPRELPAATAGVGANALNAAAVATAPPVPPWFRAVVWDSMLGALCPLLPIPFVDDLLLARMRRRMVERIAGRWQVALQPAQLALLAGGRRRGVLRFLLKAAIYPVKEVVRKVLYFLAVKDAVDTFSLLFHQGYLLHAALSRGALGRGGPTDDARVAATATAVHGALAATNTRPLRRLLVGVLRNSRELLRATVRWLASRLGGRRDAAPAMTAVADQGATRQQLGSPEAEQLLDRLLLALWGERGYLEQLDAELARRLWF
jgi:hypothetical protein